MPKFQPRTIKQNNAIFGLAAKHGIDHESLRDIAAEISEGRVDRMARSLSTRQTRSFTGSAVNRFEPVRRVGPSITNASRPASLRSHSRSILRR
jgi:hypothetical protein